MNFSDLLKIYMEQLDCSGKELAKEANLSTSIISRYRTGEKEPTLDSDALRAICRGLATIAERKNKTDVDYEIIHQQLAQAIDEQSFDYALFLARFQELSQVMAWKMKDLAQYTNYELSFLYRIKSGERRISEPRVFADKIAHYVADNFYGEDELLKVAECVGENKEELSDPKKLYTALFVWLSLGKEESLRQSSVNEESKRQSKPKMQSFLENLDTFDLAHYIKVIRFDQLKVPTIPFHISARKEYYGITQMRQGELDFFKATVTARQARSIFMYTDMPMTDMAEDMEFNKKWMFGIACAIKKGLHLQIIHHLNRPFHELLLGLEAWIPIYMTGQVSPYYIPNDTSPVFHHLNYVSEAAVLTGEGVQGHPEDGKYTLTNNKTELAYYGQKKNQILSHALPLMEIYTKEREKEFAHFLAETPKQSGSWHNIWPSLPIYTISDQLLREIFCQNQISTADQELLLQQIKQTKEQFDHDLSVGSVLDEFYLPTKEEFEASPFILALSSYFYHKPIYYTYDQFLQHLALTRTVALDHENYQLKIDERRIFQNIRLSVLRNEYAIISKSLSPSIHFVVRHPKLVQILQQYDVNWFYSET